MKLFLFAVFLFMVQACTAPIENLKPVAEQNQENITALAKNTQVLVSVYQTLLQASGETLINQYISQIAQEMVAVVGAPPLDLKAETWDNAFEQAGSALGQSYQKRYQNIKTQLTPQIKDEQKAQLRYSQGWIFSTVNDLQFTPAVAFDLMGKILKFRTQYADNLDEHFRLAENLLSPYDGKLVLYRQAVIGAEILLNALKQDIGQEIETAHVHSYLLSNYANNKTDFKATLTHVAKEDIQEVLTTLGERYIKKPSHREAAIKLLTTGMPE